MSIFLGIEVRMSNDRTGKPITMALVFNSDIQCFVPLVCITQANKKRWDNYVMEWDNKVDKMIQQIMKCEIL